MGRLLGKEVTQNEACINCQGTPDRDVGKQQYVREDRRRDLRRVPRPL